MKVLSKRKKLRPTLKDIRESPFFNPTIDKGMRSVSQGKIIWTDRNYVTCREHGACVAFNKEHTLWKCPICGEGAYVIWNEKEKVVFT